MASKVEGPQKQTSEEKQKFFDKVKANVLSSSGQKMTSAPAAKHTVKQKKESLRADGEQKAIDGSNAKLIAKTRLKPEANEEILAKKDNKKHVGASTTPKKSEKVDPSAIMRKRRPKKLRLVYHSPYVIRLTNQNPLQSFEESEPELKELEVSEIKKAENNVNVSNFATTIDKEEKEPGLIQEAS
ncbi:hypothetical protein Cgig2_024761 [Carnegiea gigantea]|uniref:Uncharacterized protein n=1 Tax=Carnegiea gigantea TaxID=171969 RepID=A0A9Q1QA23_9CARY|nr:hypothetical protein Cgig2_024761 [Carnegiea gigantea]